MKLKRKVLFVRQAFGLSRTVSDRYMEMDMEILDRISHIAGSCVCDFSGGNTETIVLSNVYCLANRALLSPETEAFMQ